MRIVKLTIMAMFLCFAAWFSLQDRGFMRASAQDKDLFGSLGVPTGVAASDNDYSTKVGINWDTIRGAASYRIFRNTLNNTGTATDVGTTQANYFFDTDAVQGQTYFYWVRAENGANVSGFSTPDQGVRSAGNMQGSAFAPLEPPPAPAGNPVTAAKAYLGKALFWDEQMSSARTVACGTCHRPAAGGSDPRTVVGSRRSRNPGPDGIFATLDDVFGSPGVPQNNLDGTYSRHPQFGMREQVTGRKSPSYLNAAYSPEGLFWDGRASDVFRDPLTNNIFLQNTASLESQSVGPPVSSAEMGHVNRNWTQVAARIQTAKPLALATNIPTALATWINNRTYPQLFEEAFGTPDVTPVRIAMAIATHERTLFSDRTPLDRELYGIQPLTAQEIRGRELFVDVNANCAFCHGGSLLMNNAFHNIGVRPQTDDAGRFAVSNVEFDRGSFKTPQLRNVELRGPFMHNGSLATIEEVVEFYNRGGDFPAANVPTSVIRPLNLTTQEKADLVAFLKRPLTDDRVRNELPPFDRPTLFTETNRVPTVTGRGRPGSKFVIPEAVLVAPPIIGNPNFTVGIANGHGGAQATLVIGDQDPGFPLTIPTSGSFAHQTITLSNFESTNGFGSVNLSIPNDPQLIGRTFYGRWYVREIRAMNGIAISRLITFTVF